MVESAPRVWLPFRTITSLMRPRQDLPEGVHVVRDADEWTRQWAGPSHGHPSQPPVPAVDWHTEMCLVAALGMCSNGGYFVLIDAIDVVGFRITVRAWEIRPGPNCAVTRGITHPLHAVAVPAHAGTAELAKRIAYEDCEAAGR